MERARLFRRAAFSPSGVVAIARARGVGRRTTRIYFLQEPFGVPAVRSSSSPDEPRRRSPAGSCPCSPRPDRSGTSAILSLEAFRTSRRLLGSSGAPTWAGFRHRPDRTRPAVSRAPHPSSAKERLRRSTEGSDLGRGFLRSREKKPGTGLEAPEPGRCVPSGRRRRPRPTSRRLMSAPLGWTGRR